MRDGLGGSRSSANELRLRTGIRDARGVSPADPLAPAETAGVGPFLGEEAGGENGAVGLRFGPDSSAALGAAPVRLMLCRICAAAVRGVTATRAISSSGMGSTPLMDGNEMLIPISMRETDTHALASTSSPRAGTNGSGRICEDWFRKFQHAQMTGWYVSAGVRIVRMRFAWRQIQKRGKIQVTLTSKFRIRCRGPRCAAGRRLYTK